MIGIICAMQIEADGIIDLCENVKMKTDKKMNFILGTLHGKEVCVVVCGVGKVNAAMCALLLIEKYNPEIIINSGVAGALSPIVGIGDIVVATKSVEHDMNATALGDKQGEITFPDGNMMFFECDKQASTLLAAVCKKFPTQRLHRELSQAVIFLFPTASKGLKLTTVSVRLRVKWRVRLSVTYATDVKCRMALYEQFPMIWTKTRVWTL